jgi:hypothetical protein
MIYIKTGSLFRKGAHSINRAIYISLRTNNLFKTFFNTKTKIADDANSTILAPLLFTSLRIQIIIKQHTSTVDQHYP